jgi:hypothetical protein
MEFPLHCLHTISLGSSALSQTEAFEVYNQVFLVKLTQKYLVGSRSSPAASADLQNLEADWSLLVSRIRNTPPQRSTLETKCLNLHSG